MKWIKKGLIFKPVYGFTWMHSYAWVPTVEHINKNIFKVYFASRNKDNYSQTGFFLFDIKTLNILEVTEKPIIPLGPLGSFDDSLAVACSIITYKGLKYLYYAGWMQGRRVRYYPAIGISVSADDGKTFNKYSRAPILDRTDDDPFGMASPFVLYDDEDGQIKMWYASYRSWEVRVGEPWPKYEIWYTQSVDGVQWDQARRPAVEAVNEEAIARPWVVKEEGLYKMWYCYRPLYSEYRIGYAESRDGNKWKRLDNRVGIGVSRAGWDSEMLAYSCVFDHQGIRYMLYNGNKFGLDGIGLAYMEKSR